MFVPQASINYLVDF